MKIKIKIENMGERAYTWKYIVFRVVDGVNWYYGAWNDYDKALAQALEEGGQVAPVSEVE